VVPEVEPLTELPVPEVAPGAEPLPDMVPLPEVLPLPAALLPEPVVPDPEPDSEPGAAAGWLAPGDTLVVLPGGQSAGDFTLSPEVLPGWVLG
jgi:hypothetical protein